MSAVARNSSDSAPARLKSIDVPRGFAFHDVSLVPFDTLSRARRLHEFFPAFAPVIVIS